MLTGAIARRPRAHACRINLWELLMTPRARTGHRRPLSSLFAFALVIACSAKQEPGSKHAEATAGAAVVGEAGQDPGQSQPYPQAYPTQPPAFALPAPSDLAGNEAALDAHERALGLALDPNAPVPLSEGDRCGIVCRALQSMRQSAQYICGLAQDRCESARERVRNAEARAKDACPACATPT